MPFFFVSTTLDYTTNNRMSHHKILMIFSSLWFYFSSLHPQNVLHTNPFLHLRREEMHLKSCANLKGLCGVNFLLLLLKLMFHQNYDLQFMENYSLLIFRLKFPPFDSRRGKKEWTMSCEKIKHQKWMGNLWSGDRAQRRKKIDSIS